MDFVIENQRVKKLKTWLLLLIVWAQKINVGMDTLMDTHMDTHIDTHMVITMVMVTAMAMKILIALDNLKCLCFFIFQKMEDHYNSVN